MLLRDIKLLRPLLDVARLMAFVLCLLIFSPRNTKLAREFLKRNELE